MRAPPSPERSSSLRSAGPRTLPLGLVLALALHALGLSVLALLQGRVLPALPATAAPQPAEPLIWLERVEEPAPSVPAPPAAAAAPSLVGRERLTRAVTSRRAASLPAQEPAAAPGSEDSDGSSASEESSLAVAPESAAPQGSPPLSLDQLGVGPGHNPFLVPSASGQRSVARALGERLDHVLRSALAEHDRELGLGPEGPAIAAVLDIVMQSTTSPNTDALLLLRTDGKGETVYVEVAEASGDSDAWNAIAQSLLQALHGKQLRVPAHSAGVTMQLRVSSREQLPSGADPGLAVDLFGQEIKAGAGKKSTRLQLLTPKITLEQYQVSPSDPRVKIPVVGFSFTLVSILGDPVDIGSVARRVVHAHLVSFETHPPEPKQ